MLFESPEALRVFVRTLPDTFYFRHEYETGHWSVWQKISKKQFLYFYDAKTIVDLSTIHCHWEFCFQTIIHFD